MDKENEKEYIIPPRLNKKYLLYGYTLGEIVFILGAGTLSIIAQIIWLMPIVAAVAALSWRTPSTERNGLNTFLLLYRFYGKPQKYTLREEPNEYESI